MKYKSEPLIFARGEQNTPICEGVHGTLNPKDHYGTRTACLIYFEPYFLSKTIQNHLKKSILNLAFL